MKIEITDEELELGRKAVEDLLVEMRDSRMFTMEGGVYRGNGLVVRERDGGDSSIIRLGTADAIRLAIDAINKKRGEL